jgi:hypothetical protein
MSGGVRNVTVDNVTVIGCSAGMYVKSMLGRGGCGPEAVEFRAKL